LSDYRIFETDEFLRDISKIKGKNQEKLYEKIKGYVYPQLKESPYYGSNIKKLKNWTPETWRYRIRNYRLFYEIDEEEKIVFVIAFETRGNSY
jgi:mRNA interferase RelE/StbE